jgi:hypothetical protein
MADMKPIKGFGGLGKMGKSMEKPPTQEKGKRDPEKVEKGKVDGEANDEKTHTITEHGDGSHTTRMHDGTEEHHPDHLHMLAHIGHHITGGDKHHIAHHDGMSASTHGIHEDGQHEETMQHGSGDEAGESAKNFLSDSGDEQTQQPEEAQEAMPAYGGMG